MGIDFILSTHVFKRMKSGRWKNKNVILNFTKDHLESRI